GTESWTNPGKKAHNQRRPTQWLTRTRAWPDETSGPFDVLGAGKCACRLPAGQPDFSQAGYLSVAAAMDGGGVAAGTFVRADAGGGHAARVSGAACVRGEAGNGVGGRPAGENRGRRDRGVSGPVAGRSPRAAGLRRLAYLGLWAGDARRYGSRAGTTDILREGN